MYDESFEGMSKMCRTRVCVHAFNKINFTKIQCFCQFSYFLGEKRVKKHKKCVFIHKKCEIFHLKTFLQQRITRTDGAARTIYVSFHHKENREHGDTRRIIFFLLKGRQHEKPEGFSQSHSAKKVAQPLCVRAFRLL